MPGTEHRPGAVPDLDGPIHHDRPPTVHDGFDTDGDGVPDTVLALDGGDLVLHTDLDADGLADRLLRIHADATVSTETSGSTGTSEPVDDRPWWLPSWLAAWLAW